MDGWHTGRLLMAAEFTGNFLKLRLAVMVRGADPVLLIEVVSDPDLDADMDGKAYSEWSPRFRVPVPEGWKPRDGNPWRVCGYSGPLNASTVEDVDGLIKYVSGGGKNVGARLAALIDSHLSAPLLALRTRRMVLQFIKKDFATATVSTLIRPAESDDVCDLTLGSAQKIHQAVAAGERFTPAQRRAAGVLLKYATWQFGYWGPFKALVKSVPVEKLADAYAIAVARLSSTDGTASVPAKILIDSDDELEGWFGIPSKRTQQYLARRVRRDLAALAEQSPDTYARVASRMLITWDQPLSNFSYAPAFVMLGAESPLDGRSRYVRRPADLSARRDAHPEVWNTRPELVEKVFRSIRCSVEAFTWAYQVLESVGATPEVPSTSTLLALDSTYSPLRQLGCAAVARRPKLLGSLTEDQWSTFFRDGSDADVAAVTGALSHQQLSLSIGTAIGAVLSQPEALSERRSNLALLYLSAPKPPFTNHADADVAAVTVVIQGSGIEHQSLWGPVVSKMGQWALIDVYRSLVGAGADAAALDVVGEALLGQKYHAPDLILECLGSDTGKITDLGWRLVDAHGGQKFLFTELLPSAGHGNGFTPEIALRVVTAALPRAVDPRDVGALIRWALSVDIDQGRLAAIVSQNSFGPSAVWEALATETDGRVSRWASGNPELLQLTGDALTEQQVSVAKPAQLQLMLNYLRSNPGTSAQEARLQVAAVRSSDPSMQAEALRQLRAGTNLKRTWKPVAESGVPAGLEAAREHLESLTATEEIRQSILECLASGSPALHEMGIQLFQGRNEVAGDAAILAALSGSNDQLAQDIVAEAAASGVPFIEGALRDFDHRILNDRKSSPRAKELIKKRLGTVDAPSEPESAERIATLLQLARAGNKGDREWALMRLATWALHGAQIEGLEVSLTTDGMVAPEDVTT